MEPTVILPAGVALLLLAAAVGDVRALRIPNRLCLAVAALFVPWAVLVLPPMEILWHSGAAAVVFLGGLVAFALRAFGGGDVKLLAAVALWTGFDGLPLLLTVMALAGGLLALVLLVARRFVPAGAADLPPVLRADGPMPYGVAIAIGGWAALLPLVP